MSRIPYRCDELDEANWPQPCREFTPSVRKDMTDEEYQSFIAECEALSGDEAAFRAAGCKRQAHLMMRGGRQEYRGKGASSDESRDIYFTRLEEAPPATPKRRRTQSKSRRTTAKGQRISDFVAGLQAFMSRREAEGKPGTYIPPGEPPLELLALVNTLTGATKGGAGRREAFLHLFAKFGLQLSSGAYAPMSTTARVAALAGALSPFMTLVTVGVRTKQERFVQADTEGLSQGFQRSAQQRRGQRLGQELRAFLMRTPEGKVVADYDIVGNLNDLIDRVDVRKLTPRRVGEEPRSSLILVAYAIMLRLLQRQGDGQVFVGLVFGGGNVDAGEVINFPAKLTMRQRRKAIAERRPLLSVKDLQHLIFGVGSRATRSADIKRMRGVTPEELALWLTGKPPSRKSPRGRRLKRLQSDKKDTKMSRRNPHARMGPRWLAARKRQEEAVHYLKEHLGITRLDALNILSREKKEGEDMLEVAHRFVRHSRSGKVSKRPKNPYSRYEIYNNPEEDNMPKRRRNRMSRNNPRGSSVRVSDLANNATLHRVSARQHFRRGGAPSFDPLAELIQEFTAQPTPRVQAKPIYSRQKSPITRMTDPYARSVRAYGARPAVPVNRRNPAAKYTAYQTFEVMYNHPDDDEFGILEISGPADDRFGPAEEIRMIIAARRIAEHTGSSFDDGWNSIVSIREKGESEPKKKKKSRKARSNPDAAAAMELHHNTGMSLKQAWQCVKRGESPYDFGSQYEYRRGPYTAADASPPVNRRNPRRKKARRNPDAAAAMELHHSKGISLQDAWDIVKGRNR